MAIKVRTVEYSTLQYSTVQCVYFYIPYVALFLIQEFAVEIVIEMRNVLVNCNLLLVSTVFRYYLLSAHSTLQYCLYCTGDRTMLILPSCSPSGNHGEKRQAIQLMRKKAGT